MYCIVLIGPAGDHDSIRRGLPTSRRGGRGCSSLGCIPTQEAHQRSGNSTSRFLVPRGTGAPHKGHDTNDRDVNKEDAEDGVEQRMALLVQHDDKDEDSIHAIVIANVHETKPDTRRTRSPLKQDETR